MLSTLQVVVELKKIKAHINALVIEAMTRQDMELIDSLNEACIHIDNAINEIKAHTEQ